MAPRSGTRRARRTRRTRARMPAAYPTPGCRSATVAFACHAAHRQAAALQRGPLHRLQLLPLLPKVRTPPAHARCRWLRTPYLLDVAQASGYGNRHAPVAQLDRALASEAKGRWFEPSRARHSPPVHPRPISSGQFRSLSCWKDSAPRVENWPGLDSEAEGHWFESSSARHSIRPEPRLFSC